MTCVFTQKGIGTPVSWEEGVAMAAECQRNGDMDWEFGGDGVSISPATPEEVSLHFVAGELPHVAVLTRADGVIETRVTPNRKAATRSAYQDGHGKIGKRPSLRASVCQAPLRREGNAWASRQGKPLPKFSSAQRP
jgi:hypothetical protein